MSERGSALRLAAFLRRVSDWFVLLAFKAMRLAHAVEEEGGHDAR